ncbi:MAG TPA: SDR family NAD(P)-dependent oxidoreductase [Rhizomicrobium sp.]|nr:SDR family NAD(P)-dependent oxidoreductase [Rhizomicrobium sp.]
MTKTAMVTGGGGAIARALSKLLVERGYRLTLVDIDAASLAAAAATLPIAAETITADLSTAEGASAVEREILSRPELDLLVNNAGIIRPGNIVDLPFAEMERHIAINLLAPMRLTKAAASVMTRRGAGTILSVVSAAGLVALPGSAAYSASKFGLRGFLTAANLELESRGVRVRGVFPGAVDTPMLRFEATHGGSVLNFLNKDVLSAEDVANACLRAMDGKKLETHLPFSDSITARLVCAAPALMPRIIPIFQKQGEKGLKRFLQSRGLEVQS